MTLREIALIAVFTTWTLGNVIANWDFSEAAWFHEYILTFVSIVVRALIVPVIVCGIIYIIFF